MFYAQVIVAKRTRAQELTYAVPAAIVPYIGPGSLVTVPLKSGEVSAVVVKLVKTIPAELKGKIRSMLTIDRNALVSPETIRLIDQLAKYYGASVAEVAFHILGHQDKTDGAVPDTPRIAELPIFLMAPWAERLKYYLEFCRKSKANTLILFPLIESANRFSSMLSKADMDRVTVGTISAAFTSLPVGSNIIVDRPMHSGGKQQKRPYMTCRTIAWLRAKNEGHQLLIGNEIIPPNYLLAVKSRQIRLISMLPTQVSVKVVAQNSQKFQESTVEAVHQFFELGKKVLIITASADWASSLICKDCGEIVSCSTCSRTIAMSDALNLSCGFCGNKQPLPKSCSRCRANNFKSVGRGASKVVEELESFKLSRGKVQPIWKDPNGRMTVITTQSLPRIEEKYDLVVLSGFDRMRMSRTGSGTWSLLGMLIEVQGIAKSIIIETDSPDEPIWGVVTAAKLKEHLSMELSERKKYKLPPYGQELAIRATATHQSAERLICTAEEVLNDYDNIVVSETVRQPRGRYETISIRLHSINKLPGELLKKIQLSLGPAWQLDLD